MKTNKIYSLLAMVCLAALSLNSCKKSDSAKASANLLTSAPWKATTEEWRATVGGNWVDKTPTGQVIVTVLTFYDNGTYSATAGSASGSGTWQLSSDKARLTFVASDGTITNLTVSALTGTTLQFSKQLDNTYTTELVNGSYKYTYYNMERDTYTH